MLGNFLAPAGKGSSPEWNENFVFTLSEGVSEITIKLLDSDAGTEDDLVGLVTIPLEPVFGGGNVPPTAYNVVKDDKYCGEIRVGLIFNPEERRDDGYGNRDDEYGSSRGYRDREYREKENYGGWKESSKNVLKTALEKGVRFRRVDPNSHPRKQDSRSGVGHKTRSYFSYGRILIIPGSFLFSFSFSVNHDNLPDAHLNLASNHPTKPHCANGSCTVSPLLMVHHPPNPDPQIINELMAHKGYYNNGLHSTGTKRVSGYYLRLAFGKTGSIAPGF
ncbi:hypothetical protein ACLOJK_024525 [Asimina triloba]